MIIQDFLKAQYLIGLKSLKNWAVMVYIVFWALILIANNHYYEQKIMYAKDLTEEVKELRSEYVDRRSELMKKRMESTISKQMEPLEIYPSTVPPKKIKVVVEKEKKWYELWH